MNGVMKMDDAELSDKIRDEFEKIKPMHGVGVMRCGRGYAATSYDWISQDYVKAFDAFELGWKAAMAFNESNKQLE